MAVINLSIVNPWLIRAIVYFVLAVITAVSLNHSIPVRRRSGADTKIMVFLRLNVTAGLCMLGAMALSMYSGLPPLIGLTFLVIALCIGVWTVVKVALWLWNIARTRPAS
jgi:hypothetical protein